jgi:hypothetical protein
VLSDLLGWLLTQESGWRIRARVLTGWISMELVKNSPGMGIALSFLNFFCVNVLVLSIRANGLS